MGWAGGHCETTLCVQYYHFGTTFDIRDIYYLGPQIPKFDTATQAILKFDTATRHNLKINMRHAIEATRFFYYLRQTTPALPTQKSINAGNLFFPEVILGLGVFCEALSRNNVFEP